MKTWVYQVSKKETWKNNRIGFVGQGRKRVNNQNGYWSTMWMKSTFKTHFSNWQSFWWLLVMTGDASYSSGIGQCHHCTCCSWQTPKLIELWKTGKYPESWVTIDIELQSSNGRPMQLTVNKNKHFKIKVTTS